MYKLSLLLLLSCILLAVESAPNFMENYLNGKGEAFQDEDFQLGDTDLEDTRSFPDPRVEARRTYCVDSVPIVCKQRGPGGCDAYAMRKKCQRTCQACDTLRM
ncbi:hypothetical protein OS493_010091 [Desmophyllum pertusum]|uniref:ShKT domain-containing protein n=1 Tax=Desmophyllum pertusum TaxID=174260 RepID=A0A9X0CG43_9CNID|nr:hypothetical protein OS493_010091 [Desmophyllum pertusum]